MRGGGRRVRFGARSGGVVPVPPSGGRSAPCTPAAPNAARSTRHQVFAAGERAVQASVACLTVWHAPSGGGKGRSRPLRGCGVRAPPNLLTLNLLW